MRFSLSFTWAPAQIHRFKIKGFVSDERGGVTILASGIIFALIGMLALAVDVAVLYYNKNNLQTAADAASLGAALSLPDVKLSKTQATLLAAQNVPQNFGTIVTANDVVAGTWDKSTKTFKAGSSNINAVRVIATRSAAQGNAILYYFARIFGMNAVDMKVTSIAYQVRPEYCVIVLETANLSGAYSAGGGGKLTTPYCGVYVNSPSATAASTANNATSLAESFCINGGYTGTFTPMPRTACPQIADPMAALPEPPVPATCSTYSSSTGSGTLNPGCYTSLNLSGTAGAKLNPGLYYIKGGVVSMKDSAGIAGEGVTIFLDSKSSMNIGASGVVSLAAPTSGTYKGVLLFQSRSAAKQIVNRFGGSSNFRFDGMLYTPTAGIVANGTASASDVQSSGYIIARQIAFTGASEFRLDRVSTGASPNGFAARVMLVE